MHLPLASASPSGLPLVIQGGMGVGVSNWRLARAVARLGQLGVVSGTALDTLLVRRLQDGDPGGDVRRARARFPIPPVAAAVLRRHFRPEGREASLARRAYGLLPMYRQTVSVARQQLTVLANFVEVWLAKEGHAGPVGLNLLTKVQLPNIASLYGAMLAGVDYVLMGAGIPREIPGVLDALAEHRPAQMRLDVEDAAADDAPEWLSLDPRTLWPAEPCAALGRPRFLPVVSATSLATTLARKANGRVDGFVVERPRAGGHNAPPGGALRLHARGQPVYGERDEVCFPYFESRRHEHVQEALGLCNVPGAVLLSDGYEAYSAYAKKTGVTHAQCWVHCRRNYFEAQAAEPQVAAEALRQIGALYKIEEDIREKKLSGEAKRLHRLTHSKPLVERFFAWVDQQFESQGFLPSNPMTQALAYARERRDGLQVFLGDPDVPMDTNHLERSLRPVPPGRRNWLFCWTEVGAQHAGTVQSLIVTCRLHGIDPYTYLVDVLQRVGQHPAARVAELTPRLWKQHFAASPLRSTVHGVTV
jgi:NAD(P)H-dependent flavin oxidoreductase YrpB (nitropropane dioxygenase family)